jgi:hypothetical protein
VHVTSIQRRTPLPASLPYAAAKAALANYSKAMANELAPTGIRVNAVAPGYVETEAAHRMAVQTAERDGIDVDTARQRIMASIGGIPLGHPGRPQDIAELVAFLLSDRAAYLVGAEFVADGAASAPSESPPVPVDEGGRRRPAARPEVAAQRVGDRRQRPLNDGLEGKAEHLGHFALMGEMCGRPRRAETALAGGEHETPERRKHRPPRACLPADVGELGTGVDLHAGNDQPRRFVQSGGQVIQTGRDPLPARR